MTVYYPPNGNGLGQSQWIGATGSTVGSGGGGSGGWYSPIQGVGAGGGGFTTQRVPPGGFVMLASTSAFHSAMFTTMPPEIKDEGIKAGEIVAYRGWKLNAGYLESIAVNQVVWCPGVPMTARHIIDNDPNPGAYAPYDISTNTSYGIYTFKDPDYARTELPGYITDHRDIILGSVYIWGKIIEYSDGYRSEYASIRSLDDIVLSPRGSTPKWMRHGGGLLQVVRDKYLPKNKDKAA